MFRENLINDINSFIKESELLYNQQKIVRKAIYENLIERIDSLKPEDFESLEKYGYFLLRYVDNPQRQKERFFLANSFRDDYLEVEIFSTMSNHFIYVLSWLN